MLLLEHDGKELLRRHGVPVAPGILVPQGQALDPLALPAGPWVVKVQVPTGGRGKAGGIRMADTMEDVAREVAALNGTTLKGHAVRGSRVEQRVRGGTEAYASLSVDAASGGVVILLSASGGVEIEAVEESAILRATAAPDQASVLKATGGLVAQLPEPMQKPLAEALARLSDVFFSQEALLVEVNPLFVADDGVWIAGDAKVILDDNALERHDDLVAMAHERADAYPETEIKLREGFDYIELDPAGTVGMVTTGAGLSMMLVDQLADAGISAFNFCDMRTGQMKGDPHRLKLVLRAMSKGGNIRVLLVNVFAGITHLGEFSRLLVTALQDTPELGDVPIVARLLGNGLDEARQILTDAKARVFLEPDLDDALARVEALVGERP
jgi:Succinyl-CoA synthetase, beta subunit